MSAENGKVCCNCRHCIRKRDEETLYTRCHCEVDGHYIGYVECHEGVCKYWSEDLSNMKFGRLTVVGLAGVKEYIDKNGRISRTVKWKCKCDCGNETTASSSMLKSGRTKSCGCLRSDFIANYNKKHGDSKTRLYRIWKGMIARCKYPSTRSYQWYGAKGVSVCKEWEDYTTFKDWALTNGYDDSLSIDRIDPYGNYEPHNCKWATRTEQRNNIRQEHKPYQIGKRVKCIETGIIYSSAKEASNILHIDISSICKVCNGKQKKAGGLTWQRL